VEEKATTHLATFKPPPQVVAFSEIKNRRIYRFVT
jgi:hypothetical protein